MFLYHNIIGLNFGHQLFDTARALIETVKVITNYCYRLPTLFIVITQPEGSLIHILPFRRG